LHDLVASVLIRSPDAIGIFLLELNHALADGELPFELGVFPGNPLQEIQGRRVPHQGLLPGRQHGGDPGIALCQLLGVLGPHILKLTPDQKILPLQHLLQQGCLQLPNQKHIVDAVLPGNLNALSCLARSGDKTLLGVYRDGVQYAHPNPCGQHDKDKEKTKLVFQIPPHDTSPLY